MRCDRMAVAISELWGSWQTRRRNLRTHLAENQHALICETLTPQRGGLPQRAGAQLG